MPVEEGINIWGQDILHSLLINLPYGSSTHGFLTCNEYELRHISQIIRLSQIVLSSFRFTDRLSVVIVRFIAENFARYPR